MFQDGGPCCVAQANLELMILLPIQVLESLWSPHSESFFKNKPNHSLYYIFRLQVRLDYLWHPKSCVFISTAFDFRNRPQMKTKVLNDTPFRSLLVLSKEKPNLNSF